MCTWAGWHAAVGSVISLWISNVLRLGLLMIFVQNKHDWKVLLCFLNSRFTDVIHCARYYEWEGASGVGALSEDGNLIRLVQHLTAHRKWLLQGGWFRDLNESECFTVKNKVPRIQLSVMLCGVILFQMGQFYYAAKAFDALERLDQNPEYWEGKRGACVGIFQLILAGRESRYEPMPSYYSTRSFKSNCC